LAILHTWKIDTRYFPRAEGRLLLRLFSARLQVGFDFLFAEVLALSSEYRLHLRNGFAFSFELPNTFGQFYFGLPPWFPFDPKSGPVPEVCSDGIIE
jgi:hypothetical protein